MLPACWVESKKERPLAKGKSSHARGAGNERVGEDGAFAEVGIPERGPLLVFQC